MHEQGKLFLVLALLEVVRFHHICRNTGKSCRAAGHSLQSLRVEALVLLLREFEVPLEESIPDTFLGERECLERVVRSYFFKIALPKYPTNAPSTPAKIAHVPGATEEARARSIERLPGVMLITCARFGSHQRLQKRLR